MCDWFLCLWSIDGRCAKRFYFFPRRYGVQRVSVCIVWFVILIHLYFPTPPRSRYPPLPSVRCCSLYYSLWLFVCDHYPPKILVALRYLPILSHIIRCTFYVLLGSEHGLSQAVVSQEASNSTYSIFGFCMTGIMDARWRYLPEIVEWMMRLSRCSCCCLKNSGQS
jgi:hypothetical protein